MTTNPYDSPMSGGQAPGPIASQWKRTLLTVLTVVGVVVVLAALLLPSVRSAREPARRTQCGNNLKQIAVALQAYASAYHALPPAYTVDAEERPLHSWRTLILPFLEEQSLYDTIDLSKPWDDPANRAAFETPVHVYRCPSSPAPETDTHYLAVVAAGGCFQQTEPRKLAEISDDHGWTLMVVETNAERAVHWMSPTDASEEWILNPGTAVVLQHPRGFHVATVSGHIMFMRAPLPPAQLRALISIAGHDDALASSEY